MPLNEYDPTELISVTRVHLEETLGVLHTVYQYFAALDVVDSARDGKTAVVNKPLTRRIERTYNHIEGYVIEDESIPSE